MTFGVKFPIMNDMLETFLGGIIGFIVFTAVTHPKSKINIKLPDKKIKNFQIFPRVNVATRNKVIHVHHWITLALTYLIIQGFIQLNIINGILLGGIFQGLLYKDRFKILFKEEEYLQQIKKGSLHIPLLQRLKRK